MACLSAPTARGAAAFQVKFAATYPGWKIGVDFEKCEQIAEQAPGFFMPIDANLLPRKFIEESLHLRSIETGFKKRMVNAELRAIGSET